MKRIAALGTVAIQPARDADAVAPGFFSKGNVASGQPPTDVSQEWMNDVQEEILAVLTAAGIVSGPAQTQLRDAIVTMINSNTGNYAVDTGAVNAYVINIPTIVVLNDGQQVRFKIGHTNTGASTLALNAFGVKAIVHNDLSALVATDLPAGGIVTVTYSIGPDKWLLTSLSPADVVLGGDVTGPAGANLIAAGAVDTDELAGQSVDNTKLTLMPAGTVKSNLTGAPAAPADNTIAALKAALGITINKFASGLHPATAGTDWSEAHGLGALPAVFKVVGYLKCINADFGYAAGQNLVISNSNGFNGSNGSGVTVFADDVNVGLAIDHNNNIGIVNKATHQSQSINPANWNTFIVLICFP